MQSSRRIPLTTSVPARLFLCVAALVLVADQLTKLAIRSTRAPGESTQFVAGILDLTYVRNTGAAFGLFPGKQSIFIATSFVVLLVIAVYWRRARPDEWPVVVAMGSIAAGATGNLIDRVMLGRVTDFLAFSFIDFPVFNIADIGIVGGVGILVLWLLFGPEPGAPECEPGISEHEPGADA